MNNKGFTLTELLLVLALVATISIGSVISINSVLNNTKDNNIASIYVALQKAGLLYIDLNKDWNEELNENNEVYVTIGELISKNYINSSTLKSVNNMDIPSSYSVKAYVTEKGHVDTCIIYIIDEEEICISNSEGLNTNCCG